MGTAWSSWKMTVIPFLSVSLVNGTDTSAPAVADVKTSAAVMNGNRRMASGLSRCKAPASAAFFLRDRLGHVLVPTRVSAYAAARGTGLRSTRLRRGDPRPAGGDRCHRQGARRKGP